MDRRLAEKILSIARGRGAEAEVYLREGTSTDVEVKQGAVDAFERSSDRGAGVRVLTDRRIGFAYTTDLSSEAISAVVDAAMASAKNTEPDPFAVLPSMPEEVYPDVATYDPAVVGVTDEEKKERTFSLERAAFAVDGRIRRIRKAATGFSETATLILNTFGAETSWRGTAVAASIEVVAEERDEAQAGWEFDSKRFLREIDIDAVGRKAAEKSLDLLGARRMDSVRAPVVLDCAVAREFLDIIRSGFSAENMQKGKSLFTSKLGQPVASSLVTVVDDGLMPGGMGSAPSDDEAVPMRTKTVIDRGLLAQFLHNARTARREGTMSTGNGIRGGIRGVPGVGITNLYILPGQLAPQDVIASTQRGLFVNEIMGAHMANKISGDFSVGATGYWIDGGKQAYPVREITIAGNIIDILRNVDAVCSDLRFSGRLGSPTLRIRELSIGGT